MIIYKLLLIKQKKIPIEKTNKPKTKKIKTNIN